MTTMLRPTLNVLRQAYNSTKFTRLSTNSKNHGPSDQQGEEYVNFPSDIEEWSQRRAKARDQTRKAFRPSVDPSTTSILLFPGQGSQFVGMGKQLLENREVHNLYAIASKIVGYDVLGTCLEGPIETLNRTEICQVATLVTSIAALETLRAENQEALDSCVAAAGFSVGEYAALVFAGALSFEDAVRLVHARALAMQAASDETPSGLMTVFLTHRSKLDKAMEAARAYCEQRQNIEKPVCTVANYLFCDAKVIGGHKQALDFIANNYKEFGLKRVKLLPVSGAFHTELMLPAAQSFFEILLETKFRTPVIPVHSNKTCGAYRSENAIRYALRDQIYHPVRWEQLMHTLYHRKKDMDFPKTYEVGPGTQLGTILKMVNNKAHRSYSSVEV